MKKFILPMALAITLAALAAEPMPMEVTVDATQVTGQISPLLFGHNLEAADPRVRESDPFHVKTLTWGQGFWNADEGQPFPAVVEQMNLMKLSALRYPGGCYAHNFDWRKAVGPRTERGIWQFGLDEYIELCRTMKAEPVITMTDYALPADELPQHLADLVEYLNAPAEPKYPWAMKRALWGHQAPYGVKYFELGNESDHGNHDHLPGRRFTPQDYIRYFTESARLIRQVDPTAQLGLVLVPGPEFNQEWNRQVLKECGRNADFVVCHFYGPKPDSGYGTSANMKAAMSYADRLQESLKGFVRLIREFTGRDLPIAVTEYNLHHNETWRYSFLGGMVNADVLRLFANPANHIFIANYWYILNDFWGAIRTDYRNQIEKTAVITFFETFAKYAEAEAVAVTCVAPRLESPAIGGYEAAVGDRRIEGGAHGAGFPLGEFIMTELKTPGVTPTVTAADGLKLEFRERAEPAYMNFAVIHRPADAEVKKPMLLELSFEARYIPAAGNNAKAVMGLGLVDKRGWNATKSGLPVRGAESSAEWKSYSDVMSTRGDCPGVFLVARLEMPDGPVSGTLEFRNIRLRNYTVGSYPAYPGAEALAMRSADGRRLTLLLFNKNSAVPAAAHVKLEHFNSSAGTFSELYQPDVASTAYFTAVTGKVELQNGAFTRLLPPHSLTAFEFRAE